jgi:hypothetical protein
MDDGSGWLHKLVPGNRILLALLGQLMDDGSG